jgi:O-antigen ligase
VTRLNEENIFQQRILTTCIIVTLIIAPNFGTDPINIIKLAALIVGLLLALSIHLRPLSCFSSFLDKFTIIIGFCFLLFSVISLFVSKQSKIEQIWGAWGRSTGLLSYLCFFLLFIAGYYIASTLGVGELSKGFSKLIIPFLAYGVLQVFHLDPIPWSRKEVFSTLGNTNFASAMYAFLGLYVMTRIIFRNMRGKETFVNFMLIIVILFVMHRTNSIQGPLIFLIGVIFLFLLKFWNLQKLVLFYLLFVTSLTFGAVAFLGLLNRGPLASIVFQETLAFRTDYWRAGISMIKASPGIGFGFDSYGDYYREYRDLLATVRTGPERVSNTAHNIFIDMGVNSGVIVMILALTIFLRPLFMGLKRMHKRVVKNENEIFFHVFNLVYFIQALISINQIGIGVWGWLICGALTGIMSNKSKSPSSIEVTRVTAGSSEHKSLRRNRILGTSDHKSSLSARQLMVSYATLLISVPIVLFPLITDNRVMHVVSDLNNPVARTSVILPDPATLTIGQGELVLNTLAITGSEKTLTYAEKLHEENPRSIYALRVIRQLGETPEARSQADEAIRILDPMNSNP